MGMFSWCCNGCGLELHMDELVRMNGCVGVYDGYGRAGNFDYQGNEPPVCWHEYCYQDAVKDFGEPDNSPSKHAENQGFGFSILKYMRSEDCELPIKMNVRIDCSWFDGENIQEQNHIIIKNEGEYQLFDKRNLRDCFLKDEVDSELVDKLEKQSTKEASFDDLDTALKVAESLMKNLPNPERGYELAVLGKQDGEHGMIYQFNKTAKINKVPIEGKFYPNGNQRCNYVPNGEFEEDLFYSIEQ